MIAWTGEVFSASAGISAEAVSMALDNLEFHRIPMHSMIIIHGKKVAVEAYWKPFCRGTLQRMCSITKSLVSLAIGVLITQGSVSLDDFVYRYFPEFSPSGIPEYIKQVRIRDMLCMKTCHSKAAHQLDIHSNYTGSYAKDWIAAFFCTCDGDHLPGTFFSYDDTSAAVLASLVERVSGMEIMSFMRKYILFETEAFTDAYLLRWGGEIPKGNSGLMATSQDIASLMDAIRDNAFSCISPGYVFSAISVQSDTSSGSLDFSADFRNGYGYYFWRVSHDGWAMFGNGGQLAVCLPALDLIMITTGDSQAIQGGVQIIMDSLWMIADGISKEAIDENPIKLIKKLESLELIHENGKSEAPAEWLFTVRSYECNQNCMGLGSLDFILNEEVKKLILYFPSKRIEIEFGINCNSFFSIPELSVEKAAASGAWQDDGTLIITVQFLGEEIGSLFMQFGITGNRISGHFRLYGELSFSGLNGTVDGTSKDF